MRSDWTHTTVGKIAASTKNSLVGGPFGSNLVASDYVTSGVPVIRGQNMTEGRWLKGPYAHVSEEKAFELSANIARPEDLIFTQRGTLGQVAMVPDAPFDRYVISQSQMKLTVNRCIAHPLFIYYLFRSPEQQAHIRNNAMQSGVPHTNLGILRATPVSIPSLGEQEAICSVLEPLDTRIEALLSFNQTLEAIARVIFKSWFVDFDPVRAKAEGREPEGLDAATAALFPFRFVDPEKKVPDGWTYQPVGEIAAVIGGTTPSTKDETYWSNGEHHWATPKDMSKLTSPVLLDTERKITAHGLAQIGSGLLPRGTVLLSSRAPIGYVAIAEVPTAINQGFIAMHACPNVSNLFLWLWVESAMDTIKARANGSTFLEVSKSNFRPIPVLVPSDTLMTAFDAVVRPLYERMVVNVRLVGTLSTLRDTLLPRLISGKLRIPQAEKLVASAL